ncbi:MAG: T9SS type A sorting domain-containing protein [Bacteroidales bacterium]|jgi:hypothetical protein|nr:T9SS type A sorting domain-containing protein [Bacteroidales bacterium]
MKITNVILYLLFILLSITGICQNLPNGWEGFSNTNSCHCIIIPKNVFPVINNVIIDSADYIGVFFSDEGTLKCGGASQYNPNKNISIFAYSNDPFVQGKNGFYSGDSIYWKIYSNKDEIEFDLSFIKYNEGEIYNSLGVFTNLGVSVIDCISAGSFTANAYSSNPDVCENNNSTVLNCNPNGGSGNYSFTWKSIPEGITSNKQLFECVINDDTFFEVTVTDNISSLKTSAKGYTAISYISPPEIIINNDTNICIFNYYIELYPKTCNYTSLQWRTNGDGYFDDYTNAITKYYFGSFDFMLGYVNLILELQTFYPCYYSTSETMKINLNEDKEISAGEDIKIFKGEETMLKGIISCFTENYEINWQPDSLLYDNNIINPLTLPLFSDVNFVLNVTDFTTNIVYEDIISVNIIDENSIHLNSENIYIYPNPFSEILKIETKENIEIKIYNIYGKLVLIDELREGVSVINTSGLNRGIYFFEMIKDDKRKVIKIVKS